ncbi:MetQ/NlpA family ABC transporter substrate-binding protein [Kineococcus rubinsiae]|uniref:MetQ/NlpA family ABC transporter substrate-binding protein n=1 Tax=Kineococcus rubinsiae TaxID=2609562 RepID=UPI00143169EF|nr:MetQ/NlpA family ABC transporter substrate-binding protein [Kineococcus rubinsiae]NIZ90735.1 metal ABC transporter substrate-binding protein [Kineococcus rubinsiae]
MSSPTPPALPSKPRRNRLPLLIAALVAVVVVAVAAVVWRTTGDDSTATAASTRTVKIGVTDKAEPYWTTYVDLAQKELGVDVELVNFSDYSLPNPALKQGELDLNQFQHVQYLANYNVTSGDDLQPIGATAVYPLPLYSTTVKDPAALPAGAKVAIPNDAINQARALLVLQAAGIVTLKDGGTAFSTTQDVTDAKVEVVALDASQTANALQSGSVAAAVVNNNYATSAKLPASDTIFSDDPNGPAAAPYVNVFAARKADAADPTYLKLAELIHDPAVEAEFRKSYPNGVLSTTDAAALQSELTTVEKDATAAGS